LLGVGVAGFLFVPSARVWGKRHCYLIGTIFVIWSAAWGGSTHNCDKMFFGQCQNENNYIQLLWSRIMQGVGLAPFEALVNASVGDLYFVHQRGKRMALTNLCLFGGSFFTPVIIGKMTHTIGWQWSFYMVSIFAGAMLPIAFFFLPETAFRRDAALNTDTLITAHGSEVHTHERTPGAVEAQTNGNGPETSHHPETGDKPETEKDSEDLSERRNEVEPSPTATPLPQKKSYWQTLRIVDGRFSDEGYFNLLLRPLPLFFHPGILWVCNHSLR
jgi:hypothetical protein